MTKPLKPITVEIEPVVIEKLITTGSNVFPDLEASKLHMDGSMVEFLHALLQQYGLEKLTLVPTAKTSEALAEYYDNDLVLRTQIELLSYLLEVDEHNKTIQATNQ